MNEARPLNMWTAEGTEGDKVILKQIPVFRTKDDLKGFLDKLKIRYVE